MSTSCWPAASTCGRKWKRWCARRGLPPPCAASSCPRCPDTSCAWELGRGGWGSSIWQGRRNSGATSPLKVLPTAAALAPGARERFLREAKTLGGLRHPNVVTVHDVIATGGVHAYAMEWVDGASLAQVIEHLEPKRSQGRIDDTTNSRRTTSEVRAFLGGPAAGADEPYPIFVCRVGIAVARALGALHRAGMVHRDVKPSNILLRKDGTALLSDFGLVHAADGVLTRSGDFAGTVAYSSPEQLVGEAESLDARSDVYALGVTLYHALALHLPFDDPRGRRTRPATPAAMVRALESRSAVPLRAWNGRLPRELETIVGKAIETQPARRYATADDLADDLERMLALQPIRARRASRLERAVKFVRRNRAATLGLGVGSVLSLGLGAALVVYVFLVPHWVKDHVRKTRLALLDPVHSNVIFTVAFYGEPERDNKVVRFIDAHGMLSEALANYDAALRWAPLRAEIREERDTVVAALGGPARLIETQSASADWHRRMGLLSFLRGQVESARKHWGQFESLRKPNAEADPLVDAALGVLYLAREEPARAYPRLREACRLFPDVGFLTMYLADAACKCGDLDVAERLLQLASSLPEGDPNGGWDRVRAELYAAQGRDAEAEASYRLASTFSPANLSFARAISHAAGVWTKRSIATSFSRATRKRSSFARSTSRICTVGGADCRSREVSASVRPSTPSPARRARWSVACASTWTSRRGMRRLKPPRRRLPVAPCKSCARSCRRKTCSCGQGSWQPRAWCGNCSTSRG
ncbi:MAG: protein kinase [Candidatus Eisenbacteria bacterium]|nr:protein kinase [Candidatus Eisenbacteria bacterium]